MSSPVTYRLEDRIATITMDDGKVNALSPGMLAEIGAAFDRAAADGAVVILSGREGRFSGGFDLNVLMSGRPEAFEMVLAGFELAYKVLSFPRPVVIACTGHAVAMGVFLLLSGDHRIAAAGSYKLVANEVAIGLTMPRAAVEICRQRLAPAHFQRAVLLSAAYSPETAVAAGFVDEVVPASELAAAARGVAVALGKLDAAAHAATKARAREASLRALRAAIDADAAEVRGR
jgi:enoyl-CoA hydratase